MQIVIVYLTWWLFSLFFVFLVLPLFSREAREEEQKLAFMQFANTGSKQCKRPCKFFPESSQLLLFGSVKGIIIVVVVVVLLFVFLSTETENETATQNTETRINSRTS